jgi:hypothetical protein
VLSLFVDIPNKYVTPIVEKCEVFLQGFYNDKIDEIESTDGDNRDNDSNQ